MTNLDSAPETTTPVKAKKEPVADKAFIDANGVDTDIEKATGLRYKSLASGTETKYQIPGAIPGEPKTMLGLFGATTLATNTASFNRGSAKPEDQFPDDTDAVADRFARIEVGDWGTKTGGGFQIDLDALFTAIGEATGEQPMGGDVDQFKNKMAQPDSAAIRRQLRNHSKVAPIYERLVREKRPVREEKPLADLLRI